MNHTMHKPLLAPREAQWWNPARTELVVSTDLHLLKVKGAVVHLHQLFQYLCSVVHSSHHDEGAAIAINQESIRGVQLAHIKRPLQNNSHFHLVDQ